MPKKSKAQLVKELEERGIEAPEKATAAQLEALLSKDHMKVSCDGYAGLNIRMEPSQYSPVVGSLADGDEVAVEMVKNGWAKVPRGWVKAEFLA